MGRHVGDLSLEELKVYRPELKYKPNDFDAFWENIKAKMDGENPVVRMQARKTAIPTIEVIDIEFESWDETPIKGMIVKPKNVDDCPTIISLHGYTGDRGLPVDYLKWIPLGLVVISFDVRGQGSSPDYARYQNGSRVPGWMLQGIRNPENYYYTNVYRDILLQLKWIRSKDCPLNPTILGLTGSSQGGGLALATAGLDKNIDFVTAELPFIAHFERALSVALSGPYLEIVNYFKFSDPKYNTYEEVLKTLGYIDCVHFCNSITCPVLIASGLEDATSPPSTVFAAYNHIPSESKFIEVYPQYKHENIPLHEEKKIEFIMDICRRNM
ncbi:acetylxylan esterase [Radiobacillus sp. PE A8.2]|uniref:acetylxylan esterase n=1 Tax=Radiobacillus sp. PE A8.2 TaxID=3380349 RepID=UPI00388D2518